MCERVNVDFPWPVVAMDSQLGEKELGIVFNQSYMLFERSMLMEMSRIMDEKGIGKDYNALTTFIKHKLSLIDQFDCAADRAAG